MQCRTVQYQGGNGGRRQAWTAELAGCGDRVASLRRARNQKRAGAIFHGLRVLGGLPAPHHTRTHWWFLGHGGPEHCVPRTLSLSACLALPGCRPGISRAICICLPCRCRILLQPGSSRRNGTKPPERSWCGYCPDPVRAWMHLMASGREGDGGWGPVQGSPRPGWGLGRATTLVRISHREPEESTVQCFPELDTVKRLCAGPALDVHVLPTTRELRGSYAARTYIAGTPHRTSYIVHHPDHPDMLGTAAQIQRSEACARKKALPIP